METKNPLTAPVLAAFGLAPDTPYKPLLSGTSTTPTWCRPRAGS